MSRYAQADGVLTSEGLAEACSHVWRDSNSVVMLGGDILNSEPVSCDDAAALAALRRHIAAAGPRSFIADILPKLGFGPKQHGAAAQITCKRCGANTEQLHLGCDLCLECCDCRP